VVVGERNGNLNYFENTGSPNEPVYVTAPTLTQLGAVSTQDPSLLFGYSTPVIVYLPNVSFPLLVTGAYGGHLQAYSGLIPSNNPYLVTDLSWGNIDDGFRSHPAFADLDNDGVLEMVTGNQRGGLSLYKTVKVPLEQILTTGSPSAYQRLQIYPNPAYMTATVQLPDQDPAQWRVYDLFGRLVAQGRTGHGTIELDLDGWAPGLYVVESLGKNYRGVGRLVVQ
jgi:hypothetical protein